MTLRKHEMVGIALTDAGLLGDAVVVVWTERPGRSSAWYAPPHTPLPAPAVSGLNDFEERRIAAAAGRHRLAVHEPSYSTDGELLGVLRHELQHALQYDQHGFALMCVAELTRQAIAMRYDGIGRDMVQIATPLERQAHQASLALVGSQLGSRAGDVLRAERKRIDRLELEDRIVSKALSFAGLFHDEMKDLRVDGLTVCAHAEQLRPGSWEKLLDAAAFGAFATQACDARPSTEELARATKPGVPWLRVVRTLLEGEQCGREVLDGKPR